MAEERSGVVWDLTSFFPEFNGSEMVTFKEQLAADLKALIEKASGLGVLSGDSAADWEDVHLRSEDLGTRAGHLFAYVGCLESTDARNEAYGQERAQLGPMLAEFSKLDVEILRAMKDVTDGDFDAFLGRKALAGMEHDLRQTRRNAQFTMTPDQEKLAADLNVDGLHSWGRIYDKVSGKLEFDMEYPDGRKERVGIARWRSLMSDVDREVGKAAFTGGNKAWAAAEDVCAAALNAIAGTRLTLNRYRGVEHFLDQPLFSAAIERETLDAMYSAIHANTEVARDIFRTKAKALKRDGIWFFEREAPLPLEDTSSISWEKGVEIVDHAFEGVYPRLAEYYRSVHRNRWIESEVRPGKRPGAFCTGSPVTREQRVYMTFNGTLGDVRTMAHEVGHAFHSHILKELRPTARHYPMTLAETASIFGEHILAEGVYSDPEIPDDQKLNMLDADLCSSAIMLLDITTRFEFEKTFHEERGKGEVSVSRLKELMVETQRTVFGDALAEGGEDPYFWASKLHFYITGVSFYNFPYTLGFLLARALFNRVKEEGPAFLPQYEKFLLLTGSGTVEEVAKESIGADVTDPEFWATSIRSISEPLARYKELTAAL